MKLRDITFRFVESVTSITPTRTCINSVTSYSINNRDGSSHRSIIEIFRHSSMDVVTKVHHIVLVTPNNKLFYIAV